MAAADVVIELLEWRRLETMRFEMGSDRRLGDPDDDEGPVRQVSVGSMIVSTTPVTRAAFNAFVVATDFVTTAEREGSGFQIVDGEPVLCDGLTWRDYNGAIQQPDRGADLEPVTQVSWADAREFCRWSGTRLLTEAEWERVAKHEPSAVTVPLLEWVADYYDPSFFRTEQRVNPTGPIGGTHRVARGAGSTTARTPYLPDMSSNRLTFRVARSAHG